MIDPDVLVRQRGPHLVTEEHKPETKCPRCGRRTRDRRGVCHPCQKAHPDLRRMTSEQVSALMTACRSELERRRSEINAALEGA